jgi:hypothetical protein
MRAIRTRLGIRALALVCAVIGLCIATACLLIALKSVKTDRAGEPLTTDGLLQIEKDVLAARQQIKSGHVILSLKDIGRSNSIREYEIFFDGDKSRADLRAAGRLQSQVIATRDEIIRVIGQQEPQVIPLKNPATSFMEIPDPRRLGLVNWCFDSINQFGYASYIGRIDRADLQVEPAIRNGDSVWMVTYKSKNGKATIEYWLSRDKGNLPIFISVTSGNAPRQVQSVDVELSKWADGEIWFPKQVRFRDVYGERVELEETITVESAEFGRAIDNATFRFVSAR